MRIVKFTKIALVLAASAMALLLVGQSARPPVAKADPVDLLTINWVYCVTLTSTIDWNGDGLVDKADNTQAFLDCATGLSNEGTFDNMIAAIRGIPGPEANRSDEIAESPPTPEDFTAPGKDPAGVPLTPMDSDAGQLHQVDGTFWVIAFVSNDEPLAFYADKGVFLGNDGLPLAAHIRCGPSPVPSADFDITDEDCDNDGVMGDGVVAVRLEANNASRGDANLRLRQGRLEMDSEYTIVGEPYRIEFTAAKTAIQTGAQVCELFKDTSTYLAALGAPQKSPVTAIVKDSDGTALTGALVVFTIASEESPRPKVARLAMARSPSGQIALTPTLSSALGVASPDVVCGDQVPGTVTIRAQISQVVPAVLPGDDAAGLDLAARERYAELEMKVQGPPTDMTLSATPPSLVCDGTATSAVSAALTDAAGNPAIDGNVVRYDVQTLATVSPIEAKSAGGAATTTVTPLTDIARGVTADATLLLPVLVEDDEDLTATDIANCAGTLQYFPCPKMTEVLKPNDLEKAFLLECSSSAPQPAPAGAPGGSTAPNISPPSTGDGGYLTGE
jgi:hypothetical protein